MPITPSSKEQSFQRLLKRLEHHLERANLVSNRFAWWRMVVFSTGGIAGLLFYVVGQKYLSTCVFAIFGILFSILFFFHSRLKDRMHQLTCWITIKRTHLARLKMEWEHIPPVDYNIPEQHPYADDLDIVGKHSLLRIMDTTISTWGLHYLASFLLSPKLDLKTVKHQQRLVKALSPRSLFRDRLILEARKISNERLCSEKTIESLRSTHIPFNVRRVFSIEVILAALTIFFLFIEYGFGGLRFWPYTLVTYLLIYFFYLVRLTPVFNKALGLQSQLRRLESLFRFLEQRKGTEIPELGDLLAPFCQTQSPPSEMIRKVTRICNALSVKANPIIHLILNTVCPWDLYFTLRYEQVRTDIVKVFPQWLDRLGQIEAISALAQFAGLHPDYIFPEVFMPDANPPRIEALALGHPLIPGSRRVVNDFRIESIGSLMLITGSNMSGKSTFLRTVGINVCLALSGAPVCAEFFSTSLIRIYCSLRITDNLEEGLSYFYAEVKRLKQILDATEDHASPSVLFLIDEVFKGTNNMERIIGSKYYLKSLINNNGLGLITTHDLELSSLEAETQSITNYHFQDQVVNGQLLFDYHLHPGPCPTTNALSIMAMEGLPVPSIQDKDQQFINSRKST